MLVLLNMMVVVYWIMSLAAMHAGRLPCGNSTVSFQSTSHKNSCSELYKVLTNALENANEPMAIVRTERQIHHGRLESKLAEMKEIATRRSGARGAKARGELIAMEEQVALSAAL